MAMGIPNWIQCLNLLTCPLLTALFIISILHFNDEVRDVQQDLADASRSYSLRFQQQEADIDDLRGSVSAVVNTTIIYVNNTVVEAKQNMDKEVQTVNDEVTQQVSAENSILAYQFAGTFAILTTVIFLYHVTAHLRHYNEPFVQRKILAILWMCPIYAVTSWLSLVFPAAEGYLAILKDLYEAYCIHMFLAFLIAVLGRGDRDAVVNLLAARAEHLHPPCGCCGLLFDEAKYEGNPRGKADAILYQCQLFAVQFVLLRPVTSIGMAVSNHVWGDNWNYASPQFAFVMIANVSIFLAFSGLVKFYHVTKQDLKWCRPFPKFLCIKGVVFMTFWQGMAIAVLAKTVYNIDDDDDDGPIVWSKRAQNFLICLEMLFFAIAHCFVFPPEEWEPGYKQKIEERRRRENGGGEDDGIDESDGKCGRGSRGGDGSKKKFGDSLALRDFYQDLKHVLKSNTHKVKRKDDSAPYEGLRLDTGSGVRGGGGGNGAVLSLPSSPEGGDAADSAAGGISPTMEEGDFVGSERAGGGDETYIIVYKTKRRQKDEWDDNSPRKNSMALVLGNKGGGNERIPIDLERRIEEYVEELERRQSAKTALEVV